MTNNNFEQAHLRGAELVQSLYNESWKNEDFKQDLIKNPIKTIENFTGKAGNFENFKNIVVEDQSNESVIYLNIPAEPNLDELELSEKELEVVAGGATPGLVVLVAAGFCGTWALDKIF